MAWREDKVTVNIVEHLGVLGQYGKDSLEANIVSWNEKPAKLDIRKWDADHDRCGKGITLTENEAKLLLEILKARYE